MAYTRRFGAMIKDERKFQELRMILSNKNDNKLQCKNDSEASDNFVINIPRDITNMSNVISNTIKFTEFLNNPLNISGSLLDGSQA